MFLLGMQYMSESLKANSGNLVKVLLYTLTKNRVTAILAGFIITSIIQSSSVTTVMLVGLANAGLMKLTQAIGVILGANIGTTITGWIVTIKISKYGLLFIGLGAFPIIFSKKSFWKHTGTILISLGFIFLGLKFMSSAMAPLKDSQSFLFLIQYFTASNMFSVLACVGIATLLTMIIQSSSAMLGVIIALANSGSISFATGTALILGANIGTTITALLASIGASATARQVAKAHTIFNLFTALIFIPLFFPFLGLVDSFVHGAANLKNHIAIHIVTAHTMFNIIGTLIFFPFIPSLAKLLEPKKKRSAPEGSSSIPPLPQKPSPSPITVLPEAYRASPPPHSKEPPREAPFL